MHEAIGVDARYILRTLLRLQGVGQVEAYPDPVSRCMWYVLRGMTHQAPAIAELAETPREVAREPVVIEEEPVTATSVAFDVRPFIRMTAGVWICYSRGCAEAGDTPRDAYENWKAKALRLAA